MYFIILFICAPLLRLAADIINAEREEFEKIRIQEYKRMRLEGSRGRAVSAWSHQEISAPARAAGVRRKARCIQREARAAEGR